MRCHFKSSLLLLPLVLGVSLAAPGPAAHGQAALCEGQEATITGAGPGGELIGTPGDDVILTQGGYEVRSLGGDDLICVTGTRSHVSLSAGEGNDRVLNQTSGTVSVILGPGDDSFVGGPGHDKVGVDGFANDLPTGSDGHDVISTGAGDDRVGSPGQPGQPNTDVIDLGEGDDAFYLTSQAGDQVTLTAGGGSDSMMVDDNEVSSWTLDNIEAQLTRNEESVASWTGVESFTLWVRGPQTFVGGPGDEHVSLYPQSDSPVQASMGAGDDTLYLSFWGEGGAVGPALTGGAGRDLLGAEGGVRGASHLTLDLPAGLLGIDSAERSVVGFEDASLQAAQLDVLGDGGSNSLSTNGCQVTVRGGGGADVLTTRHGQTYEGPLCRDRRLRHPHQISGQGGNDRLIGGSYRDHLIGGAGRDYANGGGGKDLCRAERERLCER